MKHYTRGSKRKVKRVNAQPKTEERAAGPEAVRPTPERQMHGVWTKPTGVGRNEIPVVDLMADMVASLHYRRLITDSQEQAARTFQATRAAYVAELPEVSGYKSCLAGDVPGYDDGDGDAVVIERYRAIERAVGRQGRIELLHVCEENQKPRYIDLLRWALDTIERMS